MTNLVEVEVTNIDRIVKQRDFALELRTQIHAMRDLIEESGGSVYAQEVAQMAVEEEAGFTITNPALAGWMFENVEMLLRKCQGSLSYYMGEIEKPLPTFGLPTETNVAG